MNNVDFQYLLLLQDILDNGVEKEDRTRVGTLSVFGRQMRFKMSEGFPLLTTRFIAFRIAFEEMMFFLRGETDTKKLEKKKINIWKENTSREFLDSIGLHSLPEGSLGKGYSYQWRRFGETDNCKGIDQVITLLDSLKNNPSGRRHIISAWNPQQLEETPLPPCHILQEYYVANNKLSSLFFMRSSDVYHGLPTNIAGYAFLLHIFAKYLKYELGDLIYTVGDAHLYRTQLDVVKEQLTKEPKMLPKFILKKELDVIDDIMSLEYDDIEIVDYEHCGKLKKVKMAV